ncbi:hypothetical protein ACFX11_030258 [Malus domestica]
MSLDTLQCLDPSDEYHQQIKSVEGEVDRLLEIDEIYCHQKSRVNGLKHGDKNTSFFHKHANYRAKRNLITRILDENNGWHRDENVISNTFVGYFNGLFRTAGGPLHDEISDVVHHRVLSNLIKLALKLDMAKVYDCVEWAYLEKMMHKMGFPSRFIALVMKQGDPISLYLFLIVPEGLSSLLQWAEDNSLIQCISIVPGAPMINHLFFADDSLMFCNAFLEEVNELRRIFLIYKNALGQRINFAKLAVCFSSSTGLQTKMQIHHALGVPIVLCHERYLRLPTDKIWKKINGWEGKFLSKAGKEVLIKVPCQSMSSYTISGFKLPLSSCGWSWNSLETWKHLCKIKSVGGFRFWEISSFNQALLGKQGWRLLEFPNSLIARMLKARYFKDSNFMEAQLGSYPSYTWRSLVWGRVLLHYGSRWRIGNGQAIRVYDDAWIPPSLT